MNRCFGPLRRSRYIYSFPTCGFFQSSFFAGKNSLKIILKYYLYYLHNNIFKMSKCFFPYLIYMIHPLCVISFCSYAALFWYIIQVQTLNRQIKFKFFRLFIMFFTFTTTKKNLMTVRRSNIEICFVQYHKTEQVNVPSLLM